MKPTFKTFLRRTLAVGGALLALASAMPTAAQQTVTLSGATGNSCTFSGQLTVQPNGALSIACITSSATSAAFSLSAPSQLNINSTDSSTLVTRSGGTGTLSVTYTVSGTGCTTGGGTITTVDSTPQPITITTSGTAGSCTVTLNPGTGNTAPGSPATISVVDPNAQTGGGTPTVAGCPAAATNTVTTFAGGTNIGAIGAAPYQLRMASGQIAAIPVIANIDPNVSVELTQGQQAATPATVTTEMSISPCPGVIFDPTDTTGHYVKQCYLKTGTVNFNQLTAYTKSRFSWTDQATLGSWGCWAPAATAQYYVNIRWTYSSCPFTTGCGFSMQWLQGPY